MNMIKAAIDIETYDPNLHSLGCGAVRGDGYIITVGVYCPELGIDGYLTWDELLEDEETLDLLQNPEILKIFHNGLYDLDWLVHWGHLEINNVDDTMTRETLLDAYAYSYALDACCARRGVTGKNREDTIDAWWEAQGRGKTKKDAAIEHLNEIPVEIVGKYNAQDCKATYELWEAQQPLLEEQELTFVNDVERSLYPWLMKTKAIGLHIDKTALRELTKTVSSELMREKFDFEMKYGAVNTGSYVEMSALWERLGIPIVYSTSGRPSFAHDVLADCSHPVAEQILKIRGLEKLIGTFLEGNFVDYQYKGYIHGDLYPAKRDDHGTVTGRFASANPNLQNISAREEKHGGEVRSLFIPVDNDTAVANGYKSAPNWILGAFDYKQIEYRVFIHFAQGDGVAEAQKLFWDRNGDVDYHQMIQELMGWYFPDDKNRTKAFRHVTKNVNFGSLYGLGPRSFAEKFKYPLLMAHPDWDGSVFQLAKHVLDSVKAKVPFIDTTSQLIQVTAERRGYVKTVSGRRQRFPLDKKAYKMVNYLIQGSAGDIAKKAISDSWKAGVWDVLVPHNMVHDELVFSIPDTREGYEACMQLKHCMEHAYELKIPLGVDMEIGPDWGHCNGENWEAFEKRWS